MSETPPFTIEQFYKFIGERRLMAAKCRKCASLLLPPRNLCPKCFSTELEWTKLEERGRLMTYTVIHVPPVQFQPMAPYAVGIIRLEDGPHLLGIIRGVKPEEIKVGMDLTVDFDTEVPARWPMWPRYFFKPS
ncbi:MAG: Zn-ribbon domain-containing OB-fold protein [Candidatus Bathyarchaeia archaeon]